MSWRTSAGSARDTVGNMPRERGAKGKKAEGVFLLAETELFSGMPPDELATLERDARRREIARGRCFFRQGDELHSFFLLVRGGVRLVCTNPDGGRVLLALIGPGEPFGLHLCFARNARIYRLAAEASVQSLALSWSVATLDRLIARQPAFARNLINILSRRLFDYQERIEDLATRNVSERLARALLICARCGERTVQASQQDLAELTACTRCTVSRLVSAWRRRGFLDTERREIVLRDVRGLRAIAKCPPGCSCSGPG